jgi:hypothetical protein
MHYTKFLQPHKCWDSTGSRNTTKASSCRKGATLVNLAHQWNRQLCNAKGHSAWVRVLSIRNGRHLENEQDSELKRFRATTGSRNMEQISAAKRVPCSI